MASLTRGPPNQAGYYVESPSAQSLVIATLRHTTAHFRCLRIIEFCGPSRLVARDSLRMFQLARVFQVNSNSCRSEGVTADGRRKPSCTRAAFDHP